MNSSIHSSLSVADYLLAKAEQNSASLTPLQLIKLVYLCHGWMLGLYEKPLIYETVKAWRYGPVIPDLYQKVKRFRGNPVKGQLTDESVSFSGEQENIMDQVFHAYGHLSGIQLSSLTHADGTPWSKVWHAEGMETIPDKMITEHFQNLKNEN